ncbi:PREDICTED: Fanconi anemia group I protein isoform X2 [Vollenhovia emeryi]|uniref:Fanconi anemia group I protein isoform X2 n=1 Tax=Vollenhovia emeryi TaxID=411798 RepID=UPI0005F3FA14|nr:PREDICTED: Fanconi anemia group I protein isoform X2 [Vollenhovia emeryi]
MSVKLNSLLSQKDRQQLLELVRETSSDELARTISSGICNADIARLLDEVLQMCSESESLHVKRVVLVESALKALGKSKVSISHANEIVNRIVVDFPTYPKLHLVRLVDFCLASICNNDDEFRSWKELLPVLLEVLEEERYISYMNGEVSGSKYKSLIVNNICNSKWDTQIMPSLARMFRDISLEKEDHATVITVLCTKMQGIHVEEVPPFVHQSLRLCTNQDGKYLLEALRKYFTVRLSQTDSADTLDTIDVINPREVQDVESTVLYHISQAAELNHQHIRDYVKYFKSVSHVPEAVLEPFMLSVLLTVAFIDESQIFEMLRAIINKRNESDSKRKNSAWLRKLIPESCSTMAVMVNVIEASNRDRHLVLKGLVDLAVVLMAIENKVKTDAHPLWQIGTKILQKIMRKHHETVATVFQLLIDKIIAGGSCISQYTDCLAYMCRKLTVLVLDHQESIIMLLDQISSIPGDRAIFIVSAIFPLIRVSISIRDHLLLTLRQALYRKGTLKRQMAVSGILEMLRNLNMHTLSGLAMSSSQYLNSSSTGASTTSILTQVTLERGTQARSTTRYNRTLCYDILGILRRCFTHECEVRLHLYNGLYEAILKNIEIAAYILEMLVPHFKTFFESDENVVLPVKLDLCLAVQGDQAVIQEPLAELILMLQKIYIKSALVRSSFVDELAIILESLCKRMPRLETEHLSLDDKLDLSNSSIKAQEKLQSVLLTIKIYEALISFRIDAWSVNCTDTAQNIKSLFKGYMRFVEFTKHIPKAKKGEGKNKRTQTDANTTKKAVRLGNIKLPPSIMDLSTVHKSLSLFYLKSIPWATADQVAVLIDHNDFYHYVLRTLLQILQNVKLLTEYNLRKHKEQYMKTYFEIGKLLYDHIVLDLNKVLDADEQGTILALECFKELCCLICTYFSSELPHFLSTVISNKSTQVENLNGQLESMTAALRASFRTFFGEKEEHEENSKKILGILLDIIYQLTQEINFYETNGVEVFDSMMKFTQLENMDPQASLTIFQILLWIEEHSKEYGELLIDIALALCEKMGSIDKEVEVPENNNFKIIHEDTADKLYNLVNSAVKEKLDNVSWLLVRLRAEQNIVCSPGTDLEEHQEKLRTEERSLCRQLSHVIQILYTLANVAIKPGPSTDIMFKNLQVLYNLLSNLTKYFSGKSSKQNAAFQSVKFIQVIQSAGKPLKSAFYNLITHTEENQSASKKADSHMQRNKILKETKVIPRVVFEIEQFYNEVLSLDKKTGIPLEAYIKHSITRDFRIKNTQLTEALEKMDISMLETQNSRRSNNASNEDINDIAIESPTETPAKRSRNNDVPSKSPTESPPLKRSRRLSES